MLIRRRCCCGPEAVTCCSPCKLPESDLAYDYEFWRNDGGGASTMLSKGTITLVYSSTGSNPWDGQWLGPLLCPDSVTRDVTLRCQIESGDPQLGNYIELSAPGTTAPYNVVARRRFITSNQSPGLVASFTCTPLSSQWQETDLVDLCNLGTTKVYDPDPRTLLDCCPQVVTVTGCNGIGAPGVTYEVWIDSSKDSLIFSGTTRHIDSTVRFDTIYCNMARYREIRHPRFVSVTGNKTFPGGSVTESITTPTAGYSCFQGCGLPLADTLICTFTVAGARTLVKSASTWTVNFAASGHDYVLTIGTDGSLILTRDGVSCGATLAITACPPSLSMTITPPAGDCLTELGTGTVTE